MINRIDIFTLAAMAQNPEMTVEEAVRRGHELMQQIDDATKKAAKEMHFATPRGWSRWKEVKDKVRQLAKHFDGRNLEPVVQMVQLLEEEACDEIETGVLLDAFGGGQKLVDSDLVRHMDRKTAEVLAGSLGWRFRWPDESLSSHRQEFLNLISAKV